MSSVSEVQLLILRSEHALTWQGPIRRPTRSWDTVILPTAVKEDLLTDVKEFMSDEEKEWYASKGEFAALVTLTIRDSLSSRVCAQRDLQRGPTDPSGTFFTALQVRGRPL
jgi:hypothetical protein